MLRAAPVRLLVALAALLGCGGGPAPQPPNVVVILSDDQGYADVGVYGSPDIPTPHIDSLARNGVRFSDGYASAPQCAPSRAGLLTGRYQNRFGFETNFEANGAGLPREEVTFAERMRAAGYATGWIGKWHVGTQDYNHPLARGFDEAFGFFGALSPYLPAAGKASIPDLFRGREPVVVNEYLTDVFAREAVDFIERNRARPFFLLLAFNAPHEPLQAPQARLDRFAQIQDPKRRTYAAMVSALDDGVGQVLAAIAAAGLEQRTLIFFLSDNGGPAGRMWNGASNAPLRGAKGNTFEGGIRVPFLVQWKGRLPAGSVYREPVIALDLLPTALAAAGVEVRPEWRLDGVNLLPQLEGTRTTPPHDALFWRFAWPVRPASRRDGAIRQGDWKLVTEGARQPGPPRRFEALRELIDLRADPHEDHDLSAAQPERARALAERWQAWDAELPEPPMAPVNRSSSR